MESRKGSHQHHYLMMRAGDTSLVSKWHIEGGGDCEGLSELRAIYYMLQSTEGCLLSGILIWDEEKDRGTLNLAEENGFFPQACLEADLRRR